jgi:UDP-4-amino-4,6-dideoxy-N-acetyl-beta-L-altrosamine transaminase
MKTPAPETAAGPRRAGSSALALLGGEPVRKAYLPYGHQTIDIEDRAAVMRALQADWITTGPTVAAFEGAVAAVTRARYAVAFSSGTGALHGAVFAAGLGPGDEAITTPLTFAATANCVLYQQGTPVFADVSADTLNLDPERTAERVTSKTKAVLPIDYAGHPADLDAFLELADRHGLTVIEDGCHALGAQSQGRRVGGISHMTVFSFHPVKHITTGEGGMVTTNDEALARRLRIFRNHGIEPRTDLHASLGAWYYEMVELGYNYRIPDIACALGLSQLTRLDANLARRRAIAARYGKALSGEPGLTLPAVRSGIEPAWHLYPVRISPGALSAGHVEVFRALRAENIGVQVHHIPVHLHPYYRARFGYRGGECPVAEEAYGRLISLPMFQGMSDQDVEDVIAAVRKVLAHYAC